jgi:cellulose synthase/poly-beta-1,6-N-acetylglucosamine synthase-like glycosyltransferase
MEPLLFQISLFLLCIYLLIQALSLYAFTFSREDIPVRSLREEQFPKVSVLVAARNEEHHIQRCLEALSKSSYPASQLEFLIGNDQSSDQTGAIVEQFCKTHPGFRLIEIQNNLGKAKGKANVLAHLAREAKGQCFLITDADIEVGSLWVRQMVGFFEERTGIVSGTTLVKDKGWLGNMQAIDWNYFMGLLKGFNTLGLRSTAVGNNMAITREAYEETGGYEAFDFSVTEDYKLYKEVRQRGWATKNILTRGTMNYSGAIPTVSELIHQRKRWLTGAKELPYYWWLIFSIFGMFYYALIALACFHFALAVFILLLKMTMQALALRAMENKTGNKVNYGLLIPFECYSALLILLTQVMFFIPVKVKWKQRKY